LRKKVILSLVILRDKSLWKATSSAYEGVGQPKNAIDNIIATENEQGTIFHSPLAVDFSFPYLQVQLEKSYWVKSLKIFYRPNLALKNRYSCITFV